MRAFAYVLIAIALFAVPVLAIGMGRGWTSDKPPIHWNPNMDTQEKGKAFRADQSGVFTDDHRYMRTPPEGTVARGYLHDDDQLTLGLDTEGKPLQKLPDSFLVDTNTVPRGKNRYMIYCAPCHGKDLDGKGAVFLHKGLAVQPPAFNDPRLVQMPVGQMYKAIHEGVNNNNMPAYAVQIPEKDRWAIIAFLCTFQSGEQDANKACSPEFKKPFDPTKVSKGEGLYVTKGCNACHTLDGSPKVGPSWKGLAGKQEATDKGTVTVDAAYIEESIRTPAAKIVNGFPPAMPQLPLTDDEVKTLVDFIMTDAKLK